MHSGTIEPSCSKDSVWLLGKDVIAHLKIYLLLDLHCLLICSTVDLIVRFVPNLLTTMIYFSFCYWPA